VSSDNKNVLGVLKLFVAVHQFDGTDEFYLNAIAVKKNKTIFCVKQWSKTAMRCHYMELRHAL